MPDNDYVGILDFGSQYTQLIARRTREASVYCEILPPDASPDAMKKHRLKGIILSGGPASVYQRKAPTCDPKIFDLGVPVLGICYGMQLGAQILGSNSRYGVCDCRRYWKLKSYVDNAIAEIRRTAGKDHILCALSGGVDSGVVAALVHKAVSSRLTCVFVDNGLLRKGEAKKVRDFFEKRMHVNLVVVDAANKFLNKLKGVTDPEKKRTIIGHTFIDIFKAAARPLKQVKFLAQGTLYPDVIESRSA